MSVSKMLRQRRAKLGWMAGRLLVGWCLLAVLPGARAQTPGQVDPTFGASLGLAGNVQNVRVQSDGKVLATGKFQRGIVRLNPDGSQDSYFNSGTGPASSNVIGGGNINALTVQTDGKTVVGGFFDSFSGVSCNQMVRLNKDGSLDSGFNVGSGSNNAVSALALQADGKIIVVGAYSTFAGVARNAITRLTPSGTLDTAFDPGAGINGYVGNVTVQSDGKIIVIGQFSSVTEIARNNIARLNADGSLDTSFDPGTGPTGSNGSVFALALQSDGKMIVGGGFTTFNGVARKNIVRLNADGSVDTSFNPGLGPNTGVSNFALQPDGKVVVFGDFTTFASTTRKYIARLKNDGTLDVDFDSGVGANGYVESVALQSDGQLITGGYFSNFSGTVCNGIALLKANGGVNTSFRADNSPGPNSPISSLAVQLDGKIAVIGSFTAFGGTTYNGVARLYADGALDTGFNAGTGSNYVGGTPGITVQADGKMIYFGFFNSFNGATRKNIVRLLSDGSVDPAFDPGAGAAPYGINQVAVQADGKMIVVGGFSTWNGVTRQGLARLNADGTLDANFVYSNGSVEAAALQSDGKILIVVNNLGIVRLNADGGIDTTFHSGTSANNTILSLFMQLDGKIIATGYFTTLNGASRHYIARLNADGNLDPSFNAGTISGYYVQAVSLQTDGRLIVSGNFTALGSLARHNIARLAVDGTLDASYDPGSAFNGNINTIGVQTDGKVLFGGAFNQYNNVIRNYLARLGNDGGLDPGFNPGVGSPNVNALGLQSGNDYVVIGGSFTSAGGQPANALARLRTDGSLDPAFTAPFSPGDTVPALALQTDGNIVVSQLTTTTTSPRPGPDSQGRAVIGPQTDSKIKNPIVRCLGGNGSLDTTFSASASTDGTASSVSLQANGQIVVGGSFTMLNSVGHPNLGRLNTNGTLDTTFAASTNAAVQVVLAQGDGHIAIGGLFTQVNAAARPGLARLNADGTLDATFSSTAGTDGAVLALALQSDGKLVAGGTFANASGQPRACLARFNANGTLDAAFNAGAITNAGGGAQVSAVAQQADGKLVVAGLFSQVGTSTRNNVARLNPDGSVDTTFDPAGGPNAIVHSLALQPDGKTLLGGDFTSVNSTQRNAAARLLGDYNLNNYPPLGQWRIVNFGSPDATGNAADTATPYADGVANLTKYALNLNARGSDVTPMTPAGSKGLPLAGRDASGQYLTLTFVRRQAATTPGITYLVEFSSALTAAGGFAVNPAATSAVTALDSTWERVTVSDSVPRSQQPTRFVRLRVTDP